ncbi:MAG: PTS sugar transporter subunit IIA, partial [Chloroflexi bacterium]
EVDSWETAVSRSGNLLVNTGKCTPGYIQAMIDAVHKMGPYMVLAPGLALAHARPEDGVLEMGISLITLAPPINFGSEDNDPVSLVFAFGGTDSKSHIGLLTELAELLEDDDRRESLAAAKTVDELFGIIQAFESL